MKEISVVREVLSRHLDSGIHLVTVERPGCTDYYLSLQNAPGGTFKELCGVLAGTVRELGASLVSLDVFGVPGAALPELQAAFGDLTCPVTWLEGRLDHNAALYGLLAWAVKGPEVRPVKHGSGQAGVAFSVDGFQYCRLGGIVAANLDASREEQTQSVFHRMEQALSEAGMTFLNVVRTWFYNAGMLEWYDVFNKVRTAYFVEQGLLDKFVPASTGIGCLNGHAGALTGGLLAIQPGNGQAGPREVLSPLQRSSMEYGSAFSRATEFTAGGVRRLFISGTASIEPGGRSVHIGDVRAQIELTLDVVQAILLSRDMDWNSVSRSIAYFKDAASEPVLQECMAERGMPRLPGLRAHTDICRDDLLFELELDAVAIEN